MALPGVRTTINDQFYALSRTDIPTGPRVAVIAARTTADNTSGARDLDGYTATSEKDVITAFGLNSPAHRAYVELASGGAIRIVIVPLPSDVIFDHTVGAVTSGSFGGDVFDAAFAAVEAANVDVVVPWGRGSHPGDWETPATPADQPEFGFHADNSTSLSSSWTTKVAQACFDISDRSYPIHGVLGVKPSAVTHENMTATEVANFLALPNLVSHDNPSMKSTGFYVSVIAAEVRPLGQSVSLGYANGACHYAGSMMQIDPWSSTTGKPLYNIDRLRYNPTRAQQEGLVNKGVVPVALDFARVARWIDGQTFAVTGSDYRRLSTTRIVAEVVKMVRRVAQKFIGEASTLASRNALDTSVSSGLRNMQIQGALLASAFRVSYVPSDNRAIIDLTLTPAFELRNIDISVSVNLG